MTLKTLNRNYSKWPEVKIFFNLDSFLTKCLRIISCQWFLEKLFKAIFQSKSKCFHLFVVVFLCILAGWESNDS
jgi:hypothetical protein